MLNMDLVWAMIRAEYGSGPEVVRAIVPWGSDRAVIITDYAVYRVEADEFAGFVVHQEFKR